MTAEDHDEGAAVAARVEQRWAILSASVVGLLIGVAIFAGIHRATMPQAALETANPQTMHISGEFIESNLGSAVESDGSVTLRAIGQQFSFTPQCMAVPADTPITIRATSADVVHGFLVTRTNVNLTLVPGYISILPVKFDKPGEYPMPCQEQLRAFASNARHNDISEQMRNIAHRMTAQEIDEAAHYYATRP